MGTILLILISYSISLLITKEKIYHFSSNYSNDIYSISNSENTNFIDSLFLDSFRLEYSDSVQQHLNVIYNKLQKGDLAYYQKNNIWKSAKLIFKNKTYPILLKAHGKTPNYQKIGKHISLSIKAKQPIKGLKKI